MLESHSPWWGLNLLIVDTSNSQYPISGDGSRRANWPTWGQSSRERAVSHGSSSINQQILVGPPLCAWRDAEGDGCQAQIKARGPQHLLIWLESKTAHKGCLELKILYLWKWSRICLWKKGLAYTGWAKRKKGSGIRCQPHHHKGNCKCRAPRRGASRR